MSYLRVQFFNDKNIQCSKGTEHPVCLGFFCVCMIFFKTAFIAVHSCILCSKHFGRLMEESFFNLLKIHFWISVLFYPLLKVIFSYSLSSDKDNTFSCVLHWEKSNCLSSSCGYYFFHLNNLMLKCGTFNYLLCLTFLNKMWQMSVCTSEGWNISSTFKNGSTRNSSWRSLKKNTQSD